MIQMLAVKIFSVLVNSMPDERTGSRFTWLNSGLRGCQLPQNLIDMVQVGQWYGTHAVSDSYPDMYSNVSLTPQKADSTARKVKKRPTVKFRDISKDLLRAVSMGTESTQGSDSSTSTDCSVKEDSDTEDPEEDLSAASKNDHHSPARAQVLLPNCETSFEINLHADALLDLLSDEPVGTAHRASSTSGAVASQDPDHEAEPDWNF